MAAKYTYKITCPLYDCGKIFEVTEEEFMGIFLGKCPHCKSPIWPYEMGYTGNSPLTTSRFATRYNTDGNELQPKVIIPVPIEIGDDKSECRL